MVWKGLIHIMVVFDLQCKIDFGGVENWYIHTLLKSLFAKLMESISVIGR